MNSKRAGWILVLLLLLALGAGGWWWLKTHRTMPQAADYLPDKACLFIQAPDLAATRQSYETSYLKKVLASPELSQLMTVAWKEVSAKAPPENMQKIDTAGQVWDLFQRNLTGAAFLAVTEVDFQDPSKVGCVAGLQPKQGLADIGPLVERIKKEVGDDVAKMTKSGHGKHGEVDYEWLDVDGKVRLCMAAVGPWEIFSVGEPALFDFIDRYASQGKTPGALSQNEHYKEILARLPGRQDATVYMSFDWLGDKLAKMMGSRPELKKSAATFEEVGNQLKGLGWGFKFEDGRIHETVVSLMPKAVRPDLGKVYEPCAYKSMSMTGPQTYLYMAQNMDFPKYWNYLLGLYEKTTPEAAEMMKRVPEQAKTMGLDFNKNVLNALGNEYAVLMDWPGESMFPDLAVVIDVANPADFKPTVDALLNMAAPMLAATATIQDAKAGAYDLKVCLIKMAPMISPTVIASGDKFGFFLTESGAKRMLGNAGPTLAKDPTFTALGGGDIGGTEALFYFNFGGFLDHAYQTAKPYVGMAAMMSPEVQKLLGSGKLPDKLSFTADLGGSLMRTRVDDEGSVAAMISNAGNAPIVLGLVSGISIPVLQKLGKKVEKPAVNTEGNSGGMATTDASGGTTAEGVKAELDELRAVIEAYTVAQDVPKGTAVTWAAISTYLVPDSPLQKNGGKDPVGNLYILGVVGESPADVAPETKAKFSDHDENFWKPASQPAIQPAPATTPAAPVEPQAVPAAPAGQ